MDDTGFARLCWWKPRCRNSVLWEIVVTEWSIQNTLWFHNGFLPHCAGCHVPLIFCIYSRYRRTVESNAVWKYGCLSFSRCKNAKVFFCNFCFVTDFMHVVVLCCSYCSSYCMHCTCTAAVLPHCFCCCHDYFIFYWTSLLCSSSKLSPVIER